ncbi:MAG TPA: sigma-70 family RNA polymerase sigma factor [Candidatus Limnocylindrales bacterium]|nr:sigma-70 family RNA polymerase sigma factor [Candidatus Limnocylindrales bacterium]
MTDSRPDALATLERELVERARDGDAEAFGELVTMHQAAAFRVAYVLTGSTVDAEDAAQEAFVKAYLALDRFRAGAPFRPWLLAIVGNEARNRVRSRGRRDSLADRALAAIRGGEARSSSDATPGAAAAAVSPEVEVLVGETQAQVRAALRDLGDDERRVVACRYLLGLSESETCAALGIPAGTAKSRLHRGLRRMRASLEAAGVTLEAAP